MSEPKPDYNVDYDEYEQLEAEAEQLATNPNAAVAPSPGARNTAANQAAKRAAALAAAKRAASRPEQTEDEQLAELEESDEESEGGEVGQLEENENMPKWVPFHQPEKIGIINTITREVMEGFKDVGTATGMAKILNEIDAIIVGGGYQ